MSCPECGYEAPGDPDETHLTAAARHFARVDGDPTPLEHWRWERAHVHLVDAAAEVLQSMRVSQVAAALARLDQLIAELRRGMRGLT